MRSGDMLTVQEVDRLGRNLLEVLLVRRRRRRRWVPCPTTVSRTWCAPAPGARRPS
ncbi:MULTISPECIES: hypothetical protein [Amycolatopsis]|uniref:hypothetical protein n=1 Tax=Amycolatopsis TaxID=1813 RepID=UPI0034E0C9F3